MHEDPMLKPAVMAMLLYMCAARLRKLAPKHIEAMFTLFEFIAVMDMLAVFIWLCLER